MALKNLYWLTVFFLLLVYSCQQESEPKVEVSPIKLKVEIPLIKPEIKKSINLDGKLIAIDSIDFEVYPGLMDLEAWVKDTITPLGWKIEYLVKRDSTIEEDIYIRVSKGAFDNLFYGKRLLTYRRYFIPLFIAETKDNIITTHGCATDCSAITLISKTEKGSIQTYRHVVDFNEKHKTLVYISDSTYKYEYDIFHVGIVDIERDKSKDLILNNICTAVYKPYCIDTIIYRNAEVKIVTSLRKSMEYSEYSKSTHTIHL